MVNLKLKYERLISKLHELKPFDAEFALVLGSGLGDFANSVNTIKSIETSSLPDYPTSTVEGHKGYIHFAEYEGKKLLLFQGRIHLYEGYKLSECIIPPYIASELGVKKMILTNAAGGINSHLTPGDLMLITDMNGISIKKELTDLFGISNNTQKNNLLNFPSESLNEKIRNASLDEKIFMKEGSYWFSKGPSYETPAEIQMMKKFDTDAVGMSTVHEALFAASKGTDVSAISCITNYAAGISSEKLSHNDVMQTAEIVKEKFERLIKRVITNV